MDATDGPQRGTIVKISLVIVLLAIAAGILYWHLSPPPVAPAPTQAWFYNVATGERFAGPLEAVPPIDTPGGQKAADGGPAGVKLHVFSCGKCGGGEEFVGYLEMFTEDGKAALESVGNPAGTGSARPSREAFQAREFAQGQGRLVAKEESTSAKWVAAGSTEGIEIVGAPQQKCSGQAVECFPPPGDNARG